MTAVAPYENGDIEGLCKAFHFCTNVRAMITLKYDLKRQKQVTFYENERLSKRAVSNTGFM